VTFPKSFAQNNGVFFYVVLKRSNSFDRETTFGKGGQIGGNEFLRKSKNNWDGKSDN